MRLIDADIAINILNESIAINRTDVAMGLRLAMYEIDMLPNIDAVEVVRCRECRFHEDEHPGMVYCPNTVGGWVEDNWFCKGGERKENV